MKPQTRSTTHLRKSSNRYSRAEAAYEELFHPRTGERCLAFRLYFRSRLARALIVTRCLVLSFEYNMMRRYLLKKFVHRPLDACVRTVRSDKSQRTIKVKAPTIVVWYSVQSHGSCSCVQCTRSTHVLSS